MSVRSVTSQALEAADKAAVAIFAFHDGRGRPIAWPVTPYVEGENVVVTSTLAYIRKAEHVRRDGRVALLAGGFHLKGQAEVRADVSGDEFVSRFLAQELRKYPPARQLVRIPLHRILLSWYFGRVFMEFTPVQISELPGDDRSTLTTLGEDGFPTVTPIVEPHLDLKSFTPSRCAPGGSICLPDGPATVLLHQEPTMSDLRQLVLRGEILSGMFHVRSRVGSLAPPPQRGWGGGLREQLELRRRGRQARSILRTWDI